MLSDRFDGEPTHVPLLEDVAKHDSTMVSARGKTRYPVREAAVEAIAVIKRRHTPK